MVPNKCTDYSCCDVYYKDFLYIYTVYYVWDKLYNFFLLLLNFWFKKSCTSVPKEMKGRLKVL